MWSPPPTSSGSRAESRRPWWRGVGGGDRRFEASHVLVATGRRPVLDGLHLDEASIELDDRGGLVLDDELRTTNPRVFAAGDVTGAPQFVYVAAAQGTAVAENALTEAKRHMDYAALPRVTFTRPNIAAVGLTDEQAQEAGYACECRVVELEHVPRARVNLGERPVECVWEGAEVPGQGPFSW